ncbi:hypothetical protein ACP4OV_026200 [Aristida adscensionis]
MSYLPVLILLLLSSSSCQSDDKLTQSKPLFPGDMLISRGGDFALGFFSPNSSKSLYVGIWYNNIPVRTVVWVANRDNPITMPLSGKLTITNNQQLMLSDSRGQTLWMTSNATTTKGAGAIAMILDTGNFVLRVPNGEGIWQSFDHPTDNILPNMQFLLVSYRPQVVGKLVAWKGLDDPSTGDFSYSIDPSSNLQTFVWHKNSPYYRSAVFDGVSVSGGSYPSNATSVLSIATVNTGSEFYFTYTVSDGTPYTRYWLDYTGTMRLLSWNKNTSSWTMVFQGIDHDCDLYDSCGPFSYCDHTGVAPTCQCLDGFEANGHNFSRGCRRKEALNCGEEEQFVTLTGMKPPDKFLHIPNRSFDQCSAECIRNCSCLAYAYANLSYAGTIVDTSRCLVWTGDRDLVDSAKASNYGENLYLRLALAKSTVQKQSNIAKILFPIVTCTLLLMFTALVCTCKNRGKQKKKEVQKKVMLEYLRSTDEAQDKNIEYPFISFEDIVAATDNFSDSNMLGRGGFGKVYKGILERTNEVAVKRLSKGSGQGTEQFRNEVALIAKLQHKNLVKLLGCCIHEDERLLVYEYLPNKSLDYFLFDSARKTMLQWPTRHRIIQGVARGILYLHQDSRLTIIHRDLKASNILLDKDMNPKISDFGMARIFNGDQVQANTNRIVGTYGYMSPEYAMEGTFSVKSDTYSFGVLVLEIVSGLKISSPDLIMDFSNLIVYAWNLWKDSQIEELVDSSVKESCLLNEVSRCIHIGLLCVQDSPNYRPLMSSVVFMLENKTTVLPTPMEPVSFALRNAEPGKAGDNMASSVNDMSLTAIEGR